MGILDGILSIDELTLESRRAFIRLDLEAAAQSAPNAGRLAAELRSVKHAVSLGARVVLATRRGNPGTAETLEPLAARLSEALATEIYLPDDCIGDAARKVIQDLRPGQICLLENLGFYADDPEGDEGFARELAAHTDVYVNDAPRASLKPDVSLEQLPRFVRERAMGFALRDELTARVRIAEQPERPLLLVAGGAQVGQSLDLIEKLLDQLNGIVVGGTLANTLLAARGVNLKSSALDKAQLARGRALLDAARDRKIELLLPVDFVAAESLKASDAPIFAAASLPDKYMALDVGPRTVSLYAERAARAKTVLWVGALGAAKIPQFSAGTLAFAKALADSAAFGVVAHDDTADVLLSAGEEVTSKIGFVSAAGRFLLDLIEGRRLSAVEALRGGAT